MYVRTYRSARALEGSREQNRVDMFSNELPCIYLRIALDKRSPQPRLMSGAECRDSRPSKVQRINGGCRAILTSPLPHPLQGS